MKYNNEFAIVASIVEGLIVGAACAVGGRGAQLMNDHEAREIEIFRQMSSSTHVLEFGLL